MTTQIIFTLVRPQMGENIGAAARAMMNFGIENLRIVAPRDGWPSEPAQTMAAGAFDRMPPVGVFDSLAGALADCNMAYATTARPRDINKPVISPRSAARAALPTASNGSRIAFVFGPERTGLENDEIAQCHTIVTAPVSPAFPSLNLAQCVGLMAYEIAAEIAAEDLSFDDENLDAPAPLSDFENMFARLEKLLDDGSFFQSGDLRPVMIRNLRAMLLRGGWSAQEIRTFHGVMTALARIGEKN